MLSHPTLVHDREQLLEQLQRGIRRLEGEKPLADDQRISSGCQEFDQWLPAGGWQAGSVVEWLSAGPGGGASFLALAAARGALARGGALVMCDREQTCYPPALAALGIELARVIVVRPSSPADQRWAIDQALRSPAVALVHARLETMDDKTSRRFQLAAETGGTLGLVIRPATARGRPTWAETQLAVEPLAGWERSAWRVACVRSRGPTLPGPIELEWDETTGSLCASDSHATDTRSVAPRLARATGA